MVGANEVKTALDANPAYSKMNPKQADELLAEINDDAGETSTAYDENMTNTLAMGLDLQDVMDNYGDELAENCLIALALTGSPVGVACASFLQGLQIGFQLGRGYIEE